MRYIDPHVHMISRTTDDYEAMQRAGVVAVIEPAFWMGQPRTQVGTFQDYYSHLIGFERFRAGQFGIKHYCTIAPADLPFVFDRFYRYGQVRTSQQPGLGLGLAIARRIAALHGSELTVRSPDGACFAFSVPAYVVGAPG